MALTACCVSSAGERCMRWVAITHTAMQLRLPAMAIWRALLRLVG